MKNYLICMCMGLLLGLILPDKEKENLKKERTRLTTSCINYQQKIEVLIGALQSEEVQVFEYQELPPPNVEVKNFIGIMFWITGLNLEGKPEILIDSEVHIVENKMPQLFQTPEGAKGFLLKGTFFGD